MQVNNQSRLSSCFCLCIRSAKLLDSALMIGERLEEARKAKGVSIREASEATKIRGEYLTAMEDNSFEISLPPVYVRGFLKNYAQYLNLDPQKVLTDFEAHQLGKRQPAAGRQRPARPGYGHMDLRRKAEPAPESEEPEQPQDNGSVPVSEAPPAPDTPEPEMRFDLGGTREESSAYSSREAPAESSAHAFQENRELYIKIGLALAGFVAVAVILVVLIRMLSGGGDRPEINPELAGGAQETPVTEPAPAQSTATETGVNAEPQPETMVLNASDNVTLIVEQTMNGERLFSGTLNSGETLSLEKTGPVSIRFTNGSALSVEKGGRTFRPESSGVGRTVIE